MKILFVITGLGGGGAERQLIDVAENIRNNGHEVLIAHFLNNVKIRPKDNSIKLVWLGLKSNNYFSLFRAVNKLRFLIKEGGVDIVHSHMVHANLITRFVRLFVKIPFLVCTAHSNNEGGKLRMLLYRVTHRLCDVMTSVSKDTAIEFEKKGAVPVGGIVAICNGIDTDKFKSRSVKKSREKLKFLAVGRLVEAKDYPNLLQSFSLLVRRRPAVSLDIVGEGPLRGFIELKIKELGLHSNVNLLGWRTDVDSLMSDYDFFVISSSYEGFGLVVAEAMAAGIPVIATDSGGVREIIGDFGFIAPVSNSVALFELMEKAILLDESQYNKLVTGGRDRIVKNYSIISTVGHWMEIYEKSKTVISKV